MVGFNKRPSLVEEFLVDSFDFSIDEWELFPFHERVDVFGAFLDDGFEIVWISIKDGVVFKLLLIKDFDGLVWEELKIKIVVDIAEESLVEDGWASDVGVIAITVRFLHRDAVGPLLLEENENGVLVGHPTAAVAFSHQRGL